MNPWIVAGLITWAFVGVFCLALCKAAARRIPPPPTRPRVRVRQSRENVGIVEILPSREEAR